MACMFSLFFKCCGKEKRPGGGFNSNTGSAVHDEPPIIEVITIQPEVSSPPPVVLPNIQIDDDSDDEETDSETEEKDYQKFHGTLESTVCQSGNHVAETPTHTLIEDSWKHETDQDKTDFANISSLILLDIEKVSDLSAKFFESRHPKFWQKLNGDTVDKLRAHACLIEILNDVEKEEPLMRRARISESPVLTIQSPEAITQPERIHNTKTKVQIVPSDGSGREMVCTVLTHDKDSMNLKERSSSLTKTQKINADFEVSILPNSRQLEYAREGIESIRESEAMMRKVWAKHGGKQLEDFAYPTCLVLGPRDTRRMTIAENIVFGIFAIRAGKVLLTAHSNQAVDALTLTLLSVINRLPPPDRPKIVRVIPLIQAVDPKVEHVTAQLHKVENLAAYDIVLCTLGCAPKLVESIGSKTKLPKGHFSYLFIDEAQQASELDSWMVVGNLAVEETQVFLAGDLKDGREIYFQAEVLKDRQIQYSISMLERLWLTPFPKHRGTLGYFFGFLEHSKSKSFAYNVSINKDYLETSWTPSKKDIIREEKQAWMIELENQKAGRFVSSNKKMAAYSAWGNSTGEEIGSVPTVVALAVTKVCI